MATTFEKALKNEEGKSSRIKLVNGEVLHGTIATTTGQIVEVQMPDLGAGKPIYTVPFSSILYVSNCELTK